MNDAITEDELKEGLKVAFFKQPADKVPTVITKVQAWEYDRKLFILAEGLDEWFPFYHFKKWESSVSFGDTSNKLDELYYQSGI